MRVDLDKYREAGRIASQARQRALTAVRPGVRYVDVLDEIERFIREQGADLAFPAQVSVNYVAAHDCCGPEDTRTFKAGDVLSRDNVRAIRPGLGLPTKHLEQVLGRKVNRDVPRGTALNWSLF